MRRPSHHWLLAGIYFKFPPYSAFKFAIMPFLFFLRITDVIIAASAVKEAPVIPP